MAEILCVHGIAQQLEVAETLSQAWTPALLGGLTLAGYTGREPSVAVASFGHLFRRPGNMGIAETQGVDASDIGALEDELISSWWQEAARTDPNVMPPESATMARTPFT